MTVSCLHTVTPYNVLVSPSPMSGVLLITVSQVLDIYSSSSDSITNHIMSPLQCLVTPYNTHNVLLITNHLVTPLQCLVSPYNTHQCTTHAPCLMYYSLLIVLNVYSYNVLMSPSQCLVYYSSSRSNVLLITMLVIGIYLSMY